MPFTGHYYETSDGCYFPWSARADEPAAQQAAVAHCTSGGGPCGSSLPDGGTDGGTRSETFTNGSFNNVALGSVTLSSGCGYQISTSGTLTMALVEQPGGSVSGTASAMLTIQIVVTATPPNTS